MKIQYEFTRDDFIKFNEFHAKNSKGVRKVLRIQTLLFFIFMTIVTLIMYSMMGRDAIIYLPILIVILGLYIPFQRNLNIRKILKSAKSVANQNENMFGSNTMILTERGIVGQNQNGKGHFKWYDLKQIEETNNYIFIYLSDSNALTIPKEQAFSSPTQKDQFLSFIKKHVKDEK